MPNIVIYIKSLNELIIRIITMTYWPPNQFKAQSTLNFFSIVTNQQKRIPMLKYNFKVYALYDCNVKIQLRSLCSNMTACTWVVYAIVIFFLLMAVADKLRRDIIYHPSWFIDHFKVFKTVKAFIFDFSSTTTDKQPRYSYMEQLRCYNTLAVSSNVGS